MDVQNIATHELGHSLNLSDVYGTADQEKTMYGFGTTEETKKCTLEAEDMAGIRWIYPVAAGVGDEIGTFRPDRRLFRLDYNDSGRYDGDPPDVLLGRFGQSTDIPIIGDWGGDGVDDIGVFRPSTQKFRLDLTGNGLWDGTGVDVGLGPFGSSNDIPVIGDWDGDGVDNIGVFHPDDRCYYLDLNGNGLWDGEPTDSLLGPFGQVTDIPVAGDWNNDGCDEIGFHRPSTRMFRLDFNGNGVWDGEPTDMLVGPFGKKTDVPAIGDWDGDGDDDIGTHRAMRRRFFLDLNGNGLWDGELIDLKLGPFGKMTDIGVIGNWNGL